MCSPWNFIEHAKSAKHGLGSGQKMIMNRNATMWIELASQKRKQALLLFLPNGNGESFTFRPSASGNRLKIWGRVLSIQEERESHPVVSVNGSLWRSLRLDHTSWENRRAVSFDDMICKAKEEFIELSLLLLAGLKSFSWRQLRRVTYSLGLDMTARRVSWLTAMDDNWRRDRLLYLRMEGEGSVCQYSGCSILYLLRYTLSFARL